MVEAATRDVRTAVDRMSAKNGEASSRACLKIAQVGPEGWFRDVRSLTAERRAQMDDRPTDAASPDEPSPAKKPYVAPVLVRWGTLRELTQTVSWRGGRDNWKNNRKTR
jgi:hypothetical protein